jgi:hypothetical protein
VSPTSFPSSLVGFFNQEIDLIDLVYQGVAGQRDTWLVVHGVVAQFMALAHHLIHNLLPPGDLVSNHEERSVGLIRFENAEDFLGIRRWRVVNGQCHNFLAGFDPEKDFWEAALEVADDELRRLVDNVCWQDHDQDDDEDKGLDGHSCPACSTASPAARESKEGIEQRHCHARNWRAAGQMPVTVLD